MHMHTATWPPPHQSDDLSSIVLSVRIHSKSLVITVLKKIHCMGACQFITKNTFYGRFERRNKWLKKMMAGLV